MQHERAHFLMFVRRFNNLFLPNVSRLCHPWKKTMGQILTIYLFEIRRNFLIFIFNFCFSRIIRFINFLPIFDE